MELNLVEWIYDNQLGSHDSSPKLRLLLISPSEIVVLVNRIFVLLATNLMAGY
jgi:hypothetical protein